MIAVRIANATRELGPPRTWNERENGRCTRLVVRDVGESIVQSAWEPTPAELAALNAGGRVILSVWGGQPPVALNVEMLSGDAA